MAILLFVLSLLSTAGFTKDLAKCKAPGARVVMSQFPVQDQDGLGICYANAASVMLQGSMGWLNSISYHQLAFAHAVNERASSPGLVDGGRFVGEGGWICRSVEAAKAIGFCEASTFRLDVHGGADPWARQSDAILTYGRLLDTLATKTHLTDAQWSNFTNHLAVKLRDRNNRCRSEPAPFLTSALAESVPQFILNQITTTELELARMNARRLSGAGADIRAKIESHLSTYKRMRESVLVGTPAVDNPDVITWKLAPAALEVLAQEVPQYISALMAPGQTRDAQAFFSGSSARPSIRSPLSGLYQLATGSAPGADMTNDGDAIRLVTRAYASLLDCGLGFDENLAVSIRPEEMLDRSCHSFAGTPTPGMERALQSAQEIVSNLRSQLGADLKGRMRGFMDLVAPECAAQMEQNRLSLKGRECESLILNDAMKASSTRTSMLSMFAPAERGSMISYSQDWAIDRLCNGKPLAVSVCTEFMRTETVDTQNCKTRVQGTNGANLHGNHAMAVVGYEMRPKGRSRLLVQNSWGRSCPFTDAKVSAGKDAECERDEAGELTGRFWISSEVLLKNSFDVNAINDTTE